MLFRSILLLASLSLAWLSTAPSESHQIPVKIDRISARVVTARCLSNNVAVVARDLDYGLTRMYQQLLESQSLGEVQVFRNFDKAVNWLSVK